MKNCLPERIIILHSSFIILHLMKILHWITFLHFRGWMKALHPVTARSALLTPSLPRRPIPRPVRTLPSIKPGKHILQPQKQAAGNSQQRLHPKRRDPKMKKRSFRAQPRKRYPRRKRTDRCRLAKKPPRKTLRPKKTDSPGWVKKQFRKVIRQKRPNRCR